MVIKHNDIELSFYKFINENIATPYSYPVNYGEIRFRTDLYDLWLSIVFEELGAGVKKPSTVRLDIVTRITDKIFINEEIIAMDLIREKLTNANISLYNFSSDIPILIEDEKLIIKNSRGRFTIEKIVLNNLKQEDLSQNLRRTSIFFNLELLSDTIGGRTL